MPSISEGEVWPELRIVHPELQLAGTVDLVASNYEGVRTIVDYKQNESLTVLGKYRNMQPPFRQGKLALPDLPLWHYALQLNLYARILFDRYDFEADKLLIVHLQGNGRYREYDIAILSNHVDRMLELRRQQLEEIKQ